jgi:hypothetical protein
MIDRAHDLPITRQAEALNVSRSSVYYLPRVVPEADLAIMHRLDRLHLEFPFAGSRMLKGLLAAEGSQIGRRHGFAIAEPERVRPPADVSDHDARRRRRRSCDLHCCPRPRCRRWSARPHRGLQPDRLVAAEAEVESAA